MEVKPLVSVIVTTRNEEPSIEALLKSIRAQTYPAIQLVVVDNASVDKTFEIAGRYADICFQAGPERSAQRNAGARASTGAYLLFLDADMELRSVVIGSAVNICQSEPSVGAVIIPEVSDGENYWGKCKALERNCYVDEPSVMAARFFRREVFEAVGGYDESLTGGEDWDLSQRAQRITTSQIVNAFLVHHEGSILLRDQIRKKLYYAKSFRAYQQKHPEEARKQMVLIWRPAYLRHWRDFAAQPHLAIGFLLLRFIESVAGAAGVLSSIGRQA